MGRPSKRSAPTVVDLFCGCGGFSLGAELAGFRSLVAIDTDVNLQSAYRRNFPQSKAVQGSVADIDLAAWRYFIGNTRPDAIIGGPPCQGFSLIGRRNNNDPRNTLIHDFYRHVALLRPKFFIMENVEGLLVGGGKKILLEAIQSISGRYCVLGPITINATNFGAPTNRKRVVVVGYDPDDVDPITLEDFIPKPLKNIVTVRDAISDLPGPIPEKKNSSSFRWARYPEKLDTSISKYARSLRKPAPKGLGWAEAVERQSNGFVSGVVATRHSAEVAKRYSTTLAGQTDHKTKSYRLAWDGQCPTLRAGTGADKGSFQAVRPLHPGRGRVITVREAARLQGFPDWFVFHPTKWHSFRMIGNSVSPIVGAGLLDRMSKYMRETLA